MKNAQYAAYLRDLVQQASLADPKRNIFGASYHQYVLNPVLSMKDVQAYQKKYHIVLPSEYVFFITQVGNGGAGPYYGIEPLDIDRPDIENIGTPFVTSHLTKEQWTEKLLPICSEEDVDWDLDEDDGFNEIYEQIELEIQQGTYLIGTQGCSYEIIAIASGAEENRIFYLDMDWNYEGMPYDTGMTFLEWYENFFQEIIAGNCVDSYGTRIIKTQEELIAAFEQTDDLEEKNNILNSFIRFPSLTPQTIEFFHALPEDTFAGYKLSLLLRYDTEAGLTLFEHLLETNPETALANSMLVPEDRLPKFYKTLLYLLYTIENGSEKKYRYLSLHDILLYRLGECPQFCAQDILMFLEKDSLTDDDIQTALYTLGQLPDKTEAVDTIAHFMKNGSYGVAYAALQAINHTPCSALKPVYLAMWERYHTDTDMAGHLKIAFKTNKMHIPKR